MNYQNLSMTQAKNLQFAYILSCIDGSNHGKDLTTDKDKINFVMDCFDSEYYNWRKKENNQAVLSEWLQGLPTSCNIDYENYRIIEIGIQCGYLPAQPTDKQADKFISNWFNAIACKIIQLHEKLNK
jgi:hypothetical protein